MFLGTAAKHFLQAFGRLVTSEGLSHIAFPVHFLPFRWRATRVGGFISQVPFWRVRGPARQQIPSAPKSNLKSQQTGNSWWPEIWKKFRILISSHCGYGGEIIVRGPGASLQSPAEMSAKPKTWRESLQGCKGTMGLAASSDPGSHSLAKRYRRSGQGR